MTAKRISLKTAGRCEEKHVNIVHYWKDTLPSGVCPTCKKPLIEFAKKLQEVNDGRTTHLV